MEKLTYEALPASLKTALIQAEDARIRMVHSPYSHVAIGAAVRIRGGRILTGATFETPLPNLSICAERIAIARAHMEGVSQFIQDMVITHERCHISDPEILCMACRAALSEATVIAGHILDIYIYNVNRKYILKTSTIANEFHRDGFKCRN